MSNREPGPGPKKCCAPLALEAEIETAIRVALSEAGVLIWKHLVRQCYRCGARPRREDGLGIGTSDLICVVPPYGRFLAIEVNRPRRGVLSDEQKLWLAMVIRFGGVAGVAKSVEDAMKLVSRAQCPCPVSMLNEHGPACPRGAIRVTPTTGEVE